MEENKPIEEVPECCRGCVKWQAFQKSCYVYWDNKKNCTMYVGEGEEPPVR